MKKPNYTSVLIENIEVSVTGSYKIYRGNYSFYVVGNGNYHKCSTLAAANKKIKKLKLTEKQKRNINKKKKNKKPKRKVEVWYRRSGSN
jgi:hypothetical protein